MDCIQQRVWALGGRLHGWGRRRCAWRRGGGFGHLSARQHTTRDTTREGSRRSTHLSKSTLPKRKGASHCHVLFQHARPKPPLLCWRHHPLTHTNSSYLVAEFKRRSGVVKWSNEASGAQPQYTGHAMDRNTQTKCVETTTR